MFIFKTLPINGFNHEVYWNRHIYKCKDKDCRYSFREFNRFTPGSLHYSFSLLTELAKDLANLHYSYKDMAIKHNMSLSTVELYSDSLLNVPRLSLPINIGIDEISSDMAKYDSSYICTMVDNNSRSLFEILPSRSKHELSKYFERVSLEERNKVEYVTMDMWTPYRDIAYKYLKNALVCADNFHVVKELVKCFDKFRIEIMNQYQKGTTGYYLLKNYNWLFDSIDINLDNEPKYNKFFKQKMNKRDLYDLLIKVNPNLTIAYYLKESYRKFNKEATEENCKDWFDTLLDEFKIANLPCYEEFIKTISSWEKEILNSFKRPYNNRKESNALLVNFDRFRSRCLYALNKSLNYTISNNLKSKKTKGRKRGKYNKTSTKD